MLAIDGNLRSSLTQIRVKSLLYFFLLLGVSEFKILTRLSASFPTLKTLKCISIVITVLNLYDALFTDPCLTCLILCHTVIGYSVGTFFIYLNMPFGRLCEYF